MTLDGYIRVSQVKGRDGDSYITVGEQRRMIEQGAARTGVELAVVVVEEDVSGAKAASERSLGRLLERAESGESDGIIVAYQDRLSRGSLIETAEVWERLSRAGARLIAVGDGIDSMQPGQELLFNIRAAVARDQWTKLRDGWSRTVRNAVERGVHVAGTVPLGYTRAADSKRLVMNEETAPYVREAFERRASGEGWTDLARWLHEQTGTEWSSTGVHKLIRNRVYLGEARNGSFVNGAAHEPLVSGLLFQRAQAATTSSLRAPVTGAVVGKVVTQGLAECASCGKTLRPNTKHRKSGKIVISMQCQNPHCSAHATIPALLLDAEVERQVFSRLSVRLRTIWKPVKRTNRDSAELKLEQAERVRDSFVENTEALILIGKDAWNKQLGKLVSKVAAAQADVLTAVEVEELQPIWTRFYEAWEAAGILERRKLLQRVVSRIIVMPVHGQTGIPAEDRVEVVVKEARPRPAKTGFAKKA